MYKPLSFRGLKIILKGSAITKIIQLLKQKQQEQNIAKDRKNTVRFADEVPYILLQPSQCPQLP